MTEDKSLTIIDDVLANADVPELDTKAWPGYGAEYIDTLKEFGKAINEWTDALEHANEIGIPLSNKEMATYIAQFLLLSGDMNL